MKLSDTWLVAVVLAAAATGATAQENSLNRPGSGARAAGMGNAFIAVSDDGTAASWNPAGLSQLRSPEVSVVHSASWRNFFLEGFRSRDRAEAFTALKTPSTATDIEFASAAVPFSVAGRPVTVQGGWRRLYQFSARQEGDIRRIAISPTSRPESMIHLDGGSTGSVNLWTLAAAARLTSRLSVGWSADFYHGGWEDRVNTNEDPGILGPTDFNSGRFANRIGGHSFNLGLLLAYPRVRAGVVYHGALRSKFEVTQSGRSNLTPPFDRHLGLDNGAGLRFPHSIGVGVAWLPRPLVRAALDFTYDEWTKFLIEGNPDSPYPVLSGFDGLPPELSATRNTVTVNAGLEKLFPVQGRYVPLRLGFTHEPQGGRDGWLRDSSDQMVLAAGSGLNSNNVKLDIAVEYRWGGFRGSANFSPVYQVDRAQDYGLPFSPQAEGTIRIQEWRLKTSVIYRITHTDAIKDALRKAFGS